MKVDTKGFSDKNRNTDTSFFSSSDEETKGKMSGKGKKKGKGKKQQSKNFTQKINASRKELMSKSTRKIDRKPIQNSAREMPGRGLENFLGPRWPFRAGFQTQLKVDEKIEGFWDAPGTSRELPGHGRSWAVTLLFIAYPGSS